MIKRTLYFGNPAYLSTTLDQLIVRLPEVENNDTLPESFKKEAKATIPYRLKTSESLFLIISRLLFRNP